MVRKGDPLKVGIILKYLGDCMLLQYFLFSGTWLCTSIVVINIISLFYSLFVYPLNGNKRQAELHT